MRTKKLPNDKLTMTQRLMVLRVFQLNPIAFFDQQHAAVLSAPTCRAKAILLKDRPVVRVYRVSHIEAQKKNASTRRYAAQNTHTHARSLCVT